jgi:hypothetical protein
VPPLVVIVLRSSRLDDDELEVDDVDDDEVDEVDEVDDDDEDDGLDGWVVTGTSDLSSEHAANATRAMGARTTMTARWRIVPRYADRRTR